MRYRLLLAALLICAPSAGRPQADGSLPEPASMRFEWVRDGAANCAGSCREWISAVGPITSDTPRDFVMFSQARDLRGATLVLDSGGGSVLASLELGRQIRRLGVRTTVGRTIKQSADPGEAQRAKLSPRGECASMCAFVLLGGVQRTVPPQARVLVHQIWPGTKRYDASAENYTAEEMVRIQRDVGRIARYTVEMGGDIELFELAMRIPPWERLRSLSPSELRRLRLQTIEGVASAPTSGVAKDDRPATKAARAPVPERGWTLVEGTPHASLLRRHALTIEGEEIGEFELSLACSGSERGYKLAYNDFRQLSSDSKADPVRDVTLRLGGERVSLAVQASAADARANELRSVASGQVTAEFIDKLRTDPNGVIVVKTQTASSVSTSIRVGGSGFAKAFPRFAKECGQHVSQAQD